MTSFEKIPTKPRWLIRAENYIGTKEVKGSKHNPIILKWLTEISAPIRDDESPWCAVFVNAILKESGIKAFTGFEALRARNFDKWGVTLAVPVVGCIVTFWRDSPSSGKGHVGFVVGVDKRGRLMVLGANQDDMVCVKPFDRSRVSSYRYVPNEVLPNMGKPLPVYASNDSSSSNEA